MLRAYTFTANLSRPVHERLDAFLLEQKDLWNAALEERIAAYQKTGKWPSAGGFPARAEPELLKLSCCQRARRIVCIVTNVYNSQTFYGAFRMTSGYIGNSPLS